MEINAAHWAHVAPEGVIFLLTMMLQYNVTIKQLTAYKRRSVDKKARSIKPEAGVRDVTSMSVTSARATMSCLGTTTVPHVALSLSIRRSNWPASLTACCCNCPIGPRS